MSVRCMSEGRSLYRINDKNAALGCHPVASFKEADSWNEKGWGIFWTVNSFNGPRRKENCTEVLAWAVDIDAGAKAEQLKRIQSIPLEASVIYETARGYHLYFDAIDGDPENYRDIVERLVEAYGGDKNAKDLCRILRVPAYLHWKYEKPFAIKAVHMSNARYTEKEIRDAFPKEEPKEVEFEQKTELRRELKVAGSSSLWERIWSLDCEYALERLSGSSACAGERFTFRRNANGNLNIFVDGKGTSCWIDRQKRIGSHDKGGPTVYQWVNWYQRNPKRTVEILKELFPEILK